MCSLGGPGGALSTGAASTARARTAFFAGRLATFFAFAFALVFAFGADFLRADFFAIEISFASFVPPKPAEGIKILSRAKPGLPGPRRRGPAGGGRPRAGPLRAERRPGTASPRRRSGPAA